jgi:tryptophanyl-tRNA synthetase
MGLVSSAGYRKKFEDDFNASSAGNCIIRYGDMKKQLAEDMARFMQPIREKALIFKITRNYWPRSSAREPIRQGPALQKL